MCDKKAAAEQKARDTKRAVRSEQIRRDIEQEADDFFDNISCKTSKMLNTTTLRENKELLAEKVHDAWWREKEKQGFHPPAQCPIYARIYGAFPNSRSTPKHCHKCHFDMHPFDQLGENIKEYDRVTVAAVLDAIEEINTGE